MPELPSEVEGVVEVAVVAEQGLKPQYESDDLQVCLLCINLKIYCLLWPRN